MDYSIAWRRKFRFSTDLIAGLWTYTYVYYLVDGSQRKFIHIYIYNNLLLHNFQRLQNISHIQYHAIRSNHKKMHYGTVVVSRIHVVCVSVRLYTYVSNIKSCRRELARLFTDPLISVFKTAVHRDHREQDKKKMQRSLLSTQVTPRVG